MTKDYYLKLLEKDASNTQPNLFSTKELFLSTCDSNGLPWVFRQMSTKDRALSREYNLRLLPGLPLSTPNGFPIVAPYTDTIDFDFVAYNERKKKRFADYALHLFCYDYLIDSSVWNNPEKFTNEVLQRPCSTAPNYSLYVDAPEWVNKMNIYKSRLIGAYVQSHGGKIIPTAGIASANSVNYAFEGLPENSIIACCGVGHNFCSSARTLWEYGLRSLEEQKNPILIIVYGAECKILGLQTPTIFIEDQITKYHR